MNLHIALRIPGIVRQNKTANCLDRDTKPMIYFFPKAIKKEKGMAMEKKIDNDTFVQKNFEKLVEKYAHQHIVICNGEIFTGEDAAKKAREKYPDFIPMVLPVPGPEFFKHHHLL